MNNINTLIANLHSAICEPEKEIEALQKELDELKASIPKIKADGVREAVRNCEVTNNGYEGFLSQMDLIKYANQLEGKE